ncbi:MAG: hypothetical protein P8L33_05930 [Gammaproteobacteria bacterium]|nr:hypothetical protein [Gammaproteobacteria bacterium]
MDINLMDILLTIIALTIIYGTLLYMLFKIYDFKKMIYLSFSILIFFVFLQIKIFNNLGYPVISELPEKFNILFVKKSDDEFIVLLKDISDNSLPRLYILKYSNNLEDILNEAMSKIDNGKRIIGIIDHSSVNNYYGISIKDMKKIVPDK